MSAFPRPPVDTRLWASGAAKGGAWADQAPVPGANSPSAPALAVFQHTLHMAWRAEDDTDSIWLSSTGDGNSWATPWNLPYVGTSERPALSAVGDAGAETLYLAWKGQGRDQSIYWSASTDGQKWEDQQILGGGETCRGPSLIVFRGVLHAFWRGGEQLITSNQNIYCAVHGAAGWSAPMALPGMASMESPALAVLDDTLYLAHRGTKVPLDDDTWIRLWSSRNGVSWTSRANPSEAYSELAPALAAQDRHLHLTWKSASGPDIWYSAFDGDQTWQPPTRAAAFGTACSPAVCAFRPAVGTSELHLAWRGSTL